MASYTQRDPNVVTPLGCLTITKLPPMSGCGSAAQYRWPGDASGVYHLELLLTTTGQFSDSKIYFSQIWCMVKWWRYANWDKPPSVLGITFIWHSCNLRVRVRKKLLNNGSRSAYVNQNWKNLSRSLLWIGCLLLWPWEFNRVNGAGRAIKNLVRMYKGAQSRSCT